MEMTRSIHWLFGPGRIGDRQRDIEGKRNRGMDSAAVGFGYGTAEERKPAPQAYTAAAVYPPAELPRG